MKNQAFKQRTATVHTLPPLLAHVFWSRMLSCLLFTSLFFHEALGASPTAPASMKWLTLDGKQPVVVARGGFSGLFPESSDFANQMAIQMSLSDMILQCNLQLTKDGIGICQPDIRLDNTTNIQQIYPKQAKTHGVNGEAVSGWFTVDYTAEQLLLNVTLIQNIYSRPSVFDGQLPISALEDVINSHSTLIWLNVQNEAFYEEQKLDIATYVQEASKLWRVDYISSPEIGLLKKTKRKIYKEHTKLLLVFGERDAVEPTTNQTYGWILENLGSIGTFASGIVVPKDYIWPVSQENYLESPSSLVVDAHRRGLQVFASGFANDYSMSHNYSYDPSAEYLQFIDNSAFSVDGLVTDFPPTASEAIACFARHNDTMPVRGGALIITHNGASGTHAGCTDLAYQQAVHDGADIIDCSVQMSRDGVAFCSDSADLTGETNALSSFMSRSTSIPEIQQSPGIFSFELTWAEIQTLQAQLFSPFASKGGFVRDPANKNRGKLVTLAEFLEFARAKAVSGILINIENAAFLAANRSLDIVSAITAALSNATFDKQFTQQVLVESEDTSVLSKFNNISSSYKRVLHLIDEISDAPKKPVDEIKKHADAVILPRFSIIPTAEGFAVAMTRVVEEMQAANLSVYVSVLRNEYVSLAFDYLADPTIELATYTLGAGVDGIITEFPATANRYLKNSCSDPKAKKAYTILPAQPGALLSLLESQPAAAAPRPALIIADVVDPPLPAVSEGSSPDTTAPPSPRASGCAALKIHTRVAIALAGLAVTALNLLSLGH